MKSFERVMDRFKAQPQAGRDTDLNPKSCAESSLLKRNHSAEQHTIPDDPYEQLRVAIGAVFNSWMGRRAIDYRRINRIPDDSGHGSQCAGHGVWQHGQKVAPASLHPQSIHWQERTLRRISFERAGRRRVAGTRTPNPISQLKKELPKVYEQFNAITQLLEKHYGDMQDCEFTIERGKLWMLQTRTGKRTRRGLCAHRGRHGEREANRPRDCSATRYTEHLDQLLHPTVDPKTDARVLATGLPASPARPRVRWCSVLTKPKN